MVSARAADAPRPSPPPRWHTPGFAALVLAAAALLAFGNSFGGAFVFDDELSLLENPTLDSLWQAWRPPANTGVTVSGRPVLNFSFALNRALSGTHPWSYHLFNLAIHGLAAWLLFDIVRRTLARRRSARPEERGLNPHTFPVALAVAVLWLLHPLQTESVTYIVQRAESLMGMLFLLALWCFIRGATATDEIETRSARRWFAGAFIACLAGMATKEVMVAAPLIVVLYDRTFIGASWREVWARRGGVHLALAATWTVLFALVLSTEGRGGTFELTSPGAWWRYDLTQFSAITRYLALCLWPAPLVVDYGTFWIASAATVLPQALVVLGLIAVVIVALGRWPALGFLGAWFFVILAPSSLPPGTIQMIVEHRMYLPLAAPLLLAVLALERFVARRASWALVAAALACVLLTARRNADYASGVRLFSDTVAKRPQNGRAMALLAHYHRREGRLEEAQRWLERSLVAEPGQVPVLNNLGTVYQTRGDLPRAIACFEQARARAPRDATTLNNLGNALVLAGRAEEGIARIEEALRIEPARAAARLNLAIALAMGGKREEAARAFAEIVRRDPANAEAHAGYATLLQEMGLHPEALAELRAAVQARPGEATLHDRLGVALGRAGLFEQALVEFEAAVRLNPTDDNARRNAAVVRQRLGRP